MVEASNNNNPAMTDLSPLGVQLQNDNAVAGARIEKKENFLHENNMKSFRQSLENLLKEDSGSESDEASGRKDGVKGRLKARLKRSSLSAHNHQFA